MKKKPEINSKKKKRLQSRLRIILIWTIIFFIITYSSLNQNTILEQLTIIYTTSKIFIGSTIQVLTNQQFSPQINSETNNIEKEIFYLINEIRLEKGLNSVEWDPYLAKLAREHSNDMATNKYFNHTNLLGQTPAERAQILGIRTIIETETKIYTGVSENIGIMPRGIVQDVGVLITSKDIAAGMVYSWMKSEPHKKNILEKDLFFTGVGVSYDGNGKYLLTQNFQ